MDTGVYLRKLVQESAYDRIRKQWVDKVTGVHAQQQYTVPISAPGSSTSTGFAAVLVGEPSLQHMGWPSKGPRKVSKSFLTDQFNTGVKTGCKADATHVAKIMKTLKNDDGQFVFLPTEWRTAKQISSLFSRLASSGIGTWWHGGTMSRGLGAKGAP